MPDARWNDPREYDDRVRGDGRPRVYGERDRDDHDPRDSLMHDLDLPRGEQRELVVDRDREELNAQYLQLTKAVDRQAWAKKGAKRKSRQVGPPVPAPSHDALSPLVAP
jgi:hypothetical protein